jgi:GNAT superfamily N-acetyltransferase
MIIRQLESQHLDELVVLFDAYRVWYRKPTDLAGARQFLGERIENQDSVIYGAFTDQDEIVGFTQLYPLFSSTRMGKLWLLNDLFVHPDFRGRGISLLLLEKSKELAEQTNAVAVILETEKSNDIGNQLYPRAGFQLEDDTYHYFWTCA